MNNRAHSGPHLKSGRRKKVPYSLLEKGILVRHREQALRGGEKNPRAAMERTSTKRTAGEEELLYGLAGGDGGLS